MNCVLQAAFSRAHRRSIRVILYLAVFLLITLICQPISAENRKQIQMIPKKQPTCPHPTSIAPCTCKVHKKGLDIVCEHAHADVIEKALDSFKEQSDKIYWMKLRACVLARIPDYIFLGLNVQHLNIIRSNVSVIERSALIAFGTSLTDLDLSYNNIKDVPTQSFNKLRTLIFLNLNYNKITSLKAQAFEGMILLERLYIYENQIKTIHDDAFKGIGRLSRLNLGKNQLKKITTDAFHPLTNLYVLDLNDNHIEHLPNGAFLGLQKLDMLNLNNNHITSIQENVFSHLIVLNSLNIEHNKISNISDYAFSGIEDHLGWLELSHNHLNHIPSYALRSLHNLRHLDLEANHIQEVPEDAFKGYGDTLKYIVLDKNSISSIHQKTFVELHSLGWLKLAHNKLTTLTEDTVQPILDTLTHIDISSNPLTCNCEIYWLYEWLTDPINRDQVDSVNDHRCALEGKVHIMNQLNDRDFDCKPRDGKPTRPQGQNKSSGDRVDPIQQLTIALLPMIAKIFF